MSAQQATTEIKADHTRGKRGWQGAVMKVFGAHDHVVTILGTKRVAPHMLRISMNSKTLLEDLPLGATSWVRFWVPDGNGGEHQRGYTLIDTDLTSGDFSCDFVLHSPAGPASTWAKNVRPGDQVEVMAMGSKPFEVSTEQVDGYLLIGDSASLPAINQILEVVPKTERVEVLLEQHCEEDLDLNVTKHEGATVRWVPRTGPDSLADAIDDRDWSRWRVWYAPEAESTKRIRVRLKAVGVPKKSIEGRAYWAEGRAMGNGR